MSGGIEYVVGWICSLIGTWDEWNKQLAAGAHDDNNDNDNDDGYDDSRD